MVEMTKRQRVMAALRGDKVDRIPFSFWTHNFAKENSAEDLTQETMRLARELDFDFLKPQTRAQVFVEAWGTVYRPSGQPTVPPTPTSHTVREADDYGRLEPVDPTAGPLGEQLDALRLIRAGLGPDTPIIWTIFNPLMICGYMAAGGTDLLLGALRERPAPLHHALRTTAQTMAAYARAAVEAGADGLFYASKLADRGLVTPDEYQEFGTPYDEVILDAVADAPFNLMHVCGDAAHFQLFESYRVHAYNWALTPDNPTLSEVEQRTGKAVVGGVTTKPRDLNLSADDVAAEVRAARAELSDRHLLIGPGCSSSPQKADEIFRAARVAVVAA